MAILVAAGLALLTLVNHAAAQGSGGLAVDYQFPCNAGRYFDTSSLTCQKCNVVRRHPNGPPRMPLHPSPHAQYPGVPLHAPPIPLPSQGSLPSADQLSCVNCDAIAGSDAGFDNGFSQTSAWTPAAISNGVCGCVAGDNATSSVMASVLDGGSLYSRCLTCPNGTTVNQSLYACLPAGSPAPPGPLDDLSYTISLLNSQQQAGINIPTATRVRAAGGTTCSIAPLGWGGGDCASAPLVLVCALEPRRPTPPPQTTHRPPSKACSTPWATRRPWWWMAASRW